MASIGPRVSGLWSEPPMSRMGSFVEDDEDLEVSEEQDLISSDDLEDGRSRLDKTIDRIGMGSYQWTLLSLCGFGWMADNMWIQAVAIILPRVQQHYAIPDNYIGTVSSSMFAGMMIGAVGWGTCSDLMGRSAAFNATLFFTSLFGLLASLATSFKVLCFLLFLLGSAVGGSMPTDGTLLLEHMPNGKQYLVTALSVFFSFGAVFAAIVGLLVVPQNSCSTNPSIPCDVATENQGWKYLLITLGLITLTMFLARMVFFRLHESPRYLVHAGRHQEALESLQMISRFNGSDLSIALEDVDDQKPNPGNSSTVAPRDGNENDEAAVPFLQRKFSDDIETGSETIFNADEYRSPPSNPMPCIAPPLHARSITQSSADLLTERHEDDPIVHYSSVGESPTPLDSHTYATPAIEHEVPPLVPKRTSDDSESAVHKPRNASTSPGASSRHTNSPSVAIAAAARPRQSWPGARQSRRLSERRVSSIYEQKVCGVLPSFMRRPLWAWWDRVKMVLTPEWLRTTVLVWAAWCGMSLAYTMFNVFLPKLLESGPSSSPAETPKTLEQSLWDVVIFTLGGCPGAILGAYLVETPLGRRWSLAGSTFVTALFCIVFVMVESRWAVRASTIGISLSATTMYAVLYGWTPEIFGTKVRGTACGIASALSRIGGMIAPIVGGMLLVIDRSVPVYTSVVVFCVSGVCVLLLREDAGDGARKVGKVFVH